jgi:predicted MFS family arabinose efflux permease
VGWIYCDGTLYYQFSNGIFSFAETLKEKNPEAKFALHPFKELRGAFKREIIRDLFFINFLYITAFAAMQITIPILWKNHYNITDEGVGYIFMFIGIASATVQAGMIGWLNKNFGERRLLISGSVMMMIALALVPVAPQNLFIPVLALIIILISLANGCITPTLTSLISKSSARNEQGQMLGLNMSFASLARVAGPAFGGFVYDFDFTLPYFIGAGIMMCAWIFAVRVLNLKDSAANNNENGESKNNTLDSEIISAEAEIK